MKNFKSRKCDKNFTFEKYNARKEHASRAKCFRTKDTELEKIILFFNSETKTFNENKFCALKETK